MAKSAIDVGMMTNDWHSYETSLAAMQLKYDHLLKIGGGVHQHRFAAGSSVLKVNSHRDSLPTQPSTLKGVRVAASGNTDSWTTPEQVPIDCVPSGHDGIVDVEVHWRTPQFDEVIRFVTEALGGEAVGERWKVGTSWFVIERDATSPTTGALEAAGFRYLTMQVHDVVAEHRRVLALGFDSGREPVRLGETAAISFVRAPDGTWVELSQRSELTGPLPDLMPRQTR